MLMLFVCLCLCLCVVWVAILAGRQVEAGRYSALGMAGSKTSKEHSSSRARRGTSSRTGMLLAQHCVAACPYAYRQPS